MCLLMFNRDSHSLRTRLITISFYVVAIVTLIRHNHEVPAPESPNIFRCAFLLELVCSFRCARTCPTYDFFEDPHVFFRSLEMEIRL